MVLTCHGFRASTLTEFTLRKQTLRDSMGVNLPEFWEIFVLPGTNLPGSAEIFYFEGVEITLQGVEIT